MSVGNTALATVGPSPYNDSTARIHSTHTQQRTTRRPPRHCCCSSHCPCACQSVCLYLCCSLSMSLSRLSPPQSRVWCASRSPNPTQHNDCIQHRTATQLSAAAAALTDDIRDSLDISSRKRQRFVTCVALNFRNNSLIYSTVTTLTTGGSQSQRRTDRRMDGDIGMEGRKNRKSCRSKYVQRMQQRLLDGRNDRTNALDDDDKPV